ncbi:hypothetical protein N9115_02135, partial [bacterium]|nr:hypothetical protein [bacterium]
MILTEPVNISFHIPASDPLGREDLMGKLRFLPDHVELSWRLKGNVFSGGKGEMKVIDLPYGEIEHVDLIKKWFKIRRIVFRVSDPKLLGEIPAAEMGKLTMLIDERSREEVKKLHGLIDFKRSIFL